jgi:hypothetical protein
MPYRTQSLDTSEELERVQFDLMRKAGVSKRLRLAQSHMAATIRVECGRIVKQHPEWSEQEVALHWAALTYGEDLISRVRKYLQQREAAL